MRHVPIVALLLLLVACETSTDIMKTWIGKTDTDLMAQWGAPDLQAATQRGGRVLTYQATNTRTGAPLCRMNFTVSAEHKVIAVSHNCPR